MRLWGSYVLCSLTVHCVPKISILSLVAVEEVNEGNVTEMDELFCSSRDLSMYFLQVLRCDLSDMMIGHHVFVLLVI